MTVATTATTAATTTVTAAAGAAVRGRRGQAGGSEGESGCGVARIGLERPRDEERSQQGQGRAGALRAEQAGGLADTLGWVWVCGGGWDEARRAKVTRSEPSPKLKSSSFITYAPTHLRTHTHTSTVLTTRPEPSPNFKSNSFIFFRPWTRRRATNNITW